MSLSRSIAIAVLLAGCSKGGEKKKVEATGDGDSQAPAQVVEPPPGPKGIARGKVAINGEVPPMPLLGRGTDPVCARTEQRAETILVNPNGTLRNVVVRVKPGTVKPWRPGETIKVEQTDCMYRPRVQAAVAGQKMTVGNADQTAHNVHLRELPLGKRHGIATLTNRQQPKGMKPISTAVDEVDVIKLKCDQHGWMNGYIVVSDNGYAAVTGESGAFELEVPAGEITLQAWHEFYGVKEQTVTVSEGEPVEVSFTFDHATDNRTAPARPEATGDTAEGG
jgi:plastocyanin